MAKDTWSKEAGYVWSLIGSAVGFANVLSFSALCYKNGGGAFLIPYLIAHLLIGIPMLLLESIIGQRSGLPLVSAMGAIIGNKGKMLGWLAVLSCASIGGFYIVLTGFAVGYTFFSSIGIIPSDTAHFFKHVFLCDSGSLYKIGGVAIGVFVATFIVAALTWIILLRNIRSGIEKICTIFLPMLGILMLSLAIASCFLPGSFEGFKHYLLPDFARLKDVNLWRDVFGQVFFSLSLGLGIVTGYSRHNASSFNLYRSMVKVAFGDFAISLISGFAIFGCIGFMSKTMAVPFQELVTSDSAFEIGFVIFPLILSHFGSFFSHILGPLFFFSIFIAGITGVFSIVESVAGNIEVEFRKTRKTSVTLSIIIVFILSLPFCLGNGQHILGAIAPMLLGNVMLVGGIAEILFFLVLTQSFSKEKLWLNKNGNRIYPYYSLKYFVLPILLMSLFASIGKELSSSFSMEVVIRWGWFIAACLLSFYLSRRVREVVVSQ